MRVVVRQGFCCNIREDLKEHNMAEEMTNKHSVWHMKIKACSLLHRGGIYVRETIHDSAFY